MRQINSRSPSPSYCGLRPGIAQRPKEEALRSAGLVRTPGSPLTSCATRGQGNSLPESQSLTQERGGHYLLTGLAWGVNDTTYVKGARERPGVESTASLPPHHTGNCESVLVTVHWNQPLLPLQRLTPPRLPSPPSHPPAPSHPH